jgi:hypothetical protein
MTMANRLDPRQASRELSGMKRSGISLLVLPMAALLFGGVSPAAADATDDAVAKLRQGADCTNKASAHKIWCAAAEWSKGKPHTMKPGLWIGFSVSIEPDTDVGTALEDDVSLVLMRVDKDGPQLSAQLKDVEGAPGVDTKQVDAVVGKVRAALAGKGTVKLDGGIKAFGDSLKGRGTRAMTRQKAAWVWTTGHGSSVELREVGKTFVIVETPDGGTPGRTITILTEKVK